MFSKKIYLLAGNEPSGTFTNKIFDSIILDFLSDLSKEIFSKNRKIKYKEIIALGYWCRKSNLESLKKNYNNLNLQVGKGIAFHIVPSNVPINFAYSLIFGLLSGNSNIVRVGEEDNEIVKSTCQLFNRILNKKKYQKIKNENAIITYKKNDELTEYFSSISDCRILWGSDETIKVLKKFKTKVNCIDLIFADRYSTSIINPDMINPGNINKLVYNFYIDTFLMDQNACSSPHLVVWLNLNKKNKKNKKLFWEKLILLSKKNYDLDLSKSYEKLTRSLENILFLKNDVNSFENNDQILHLTKIKNIPHKIESIRGRFGSFYEYYAKNFDFLNKIQSDKLQTISYFGLDKKEIREKIDKTNLTKVSRFVPIGSTLNIDLNWDGYDVINNLSKKIVIN